MPDMHVSSAIPTGCLQSNKIWRVQLCLQPLNIDALANAVRELDHVSGTHDRNLVQTDL
jgi:hypothetical protein